MNDNRYADLLLRISELQGRTNIVKIVKVVIIFVNHHQKGWTGDFNLPISVWLPGFFNPQSFLTAIMQVASSAAFSISHQ